MLIAFRGLQGLGGALVSPAALSIITTTFPEGPERTKALGVWSAIAAGGGAVGLLLGGILTETLSWEWIFFVNVPIGAATAILSARLITESKAERAGSFDVHRRRAGDRRPDGARLRDRQGRGFGWGQLAHARAGRARASRCWRSSCSSRSRIEGPLVRLSIFKIRSLAVANVVLLLVAGGLFALFFFATLYVQEILGFTPIKAGLAFLPVTVGIGVGAGTAQVLVKRIGVRANTIVGMVIAAVGLFYSQRVPVDGTYVSDLLPGLLLMSFGMGNTFVPITLIATTNVDEHDAGLASGPVQHLPAGGRRARAWPSCRRSRRTGRRATCKALATSRGRRIGRRGWWRASRSPSRQRRSWSRSGRSCSPCCSAVAMSRT